MAITSAEIHNQSFDRSQRLRRRRSRCVPRACRRRDRRHERPDRPTREPAGRSFELRHAGSRRSSRRDGRCRRRFSARPSPIWSASSRPKGRRQRHRAGLHHRAAFCTTSSRTRMPRQRPPSKMPRTRHASWTRRKPSVEGARRHQEARGRPRDVREDYRDLLTDFIGDATRKLAEIGGEMPASCRSAHARTIDVVETPLRAV